MRMKFVGVATAIFILFASPSWASVRLLVHDISWSAYHFSAYDPFEKKRF